MGKILLPSLGYLWELGLKGSNLSKVKCEGCSTTEKCILLKGLSEAVLFLKKEKKEGTRGEEVLKSKQVSFTIL